MLMFSKKIKSKQDSFVTALLEGCCSSGGRVVTPVIRRSVVPKPCTKHFKVSLSEIPNYSIELMCMKGYFSFLNYSFISDCGKSECTFKVKWFESSKMARKALNTFTLYRRVHGGLITFNQSLQSEDSSRSNSLQMHAHAYMHTERCQDMYV